MSSSVRDDTLPVTSTAFARPATLTPSRSVGSSIRLSMVPPRLHFGGVDTRLSGADGYVSSVRDNNTLELVDNSSAFMNPDHSSISLTSPRSQSITAYAPPTTIHDRCRIFAEKVEAFVRELTTADAQSETTHGGTGYLFSNPVAYVRERWAANNPHHGIGHLSRKAAARVRQWWIAHYPRGAFGEDAQQIPGPALTFVAGGLLGLVEIKGQGYTNHWAIKATMASLATFAVASAVEHVFSLGRPAGGSSTVAAVARWVQIVCLGSFTGSLVVIFFS